MCASADAHRLVSERFAGEQKRIIGLALLIMGMYARQTFMNGKNGVWSTWFWAQPPLIVYVFVLFETAANLHKVFPLAVVNVIADDRRRGRQRGERSSDTKRHNGR